MRLSLEEILDVFRILNERGMPHLPPDVEFPGYHLNPPLPEEEVQAFETQHGIRLPEEYREFITTIGNGGGGPRFYLYGLNEAYNGSMRGEWNENRIGDLSQPFPFTEKWNLPDEFWDAHLKESFARAKGEKGPSQIEDREIELKRYYAPKIMNGAIPLNGYANLQECLIVTGSERGHVWEDWRKEDEGVSPRLNPDGTRMTFTEWYRSKLQREVERPIWEAIERQESKRRDRVRKIHDGIMFLIIFGPIAIISLTNLLFIHHLRINGHLKIDHETGMRIGFFTSIVSIILYFGVLWSLEWGWKRIKVIFVSAKTDKTS